MSMRVYLFGPFQLDIERLLLLHHDKPVALGPKVVETLLALLEHPGEVTSKGAMIERVWPEGYVEEANLAQNIYVLRKALRELAGMDVIETVPRRGYRFTGAVTLKERSNEAPARAWRLPHLAYPMAALLALVLVLLGAAGLAHRTTSEGLSPSSTRLYLLGSYYWNLRSREGVERSMDYFAQVIRNDPQDARGYAALADANATMGDYHYGSLAPAAYFGRARALADRALALNPESAEAHAALGLIDLDNRRLAASIVELRRAIELDPRYAPAREWYGIALISRGQLPQAMEQLQTGADLDPLSVATSAWLGSAAYLDRHFNEAIAYSRETLDLAPGRTYVWTTIGESYEAQGEYVQAVGAFKRYGAACSSCRAEADALLAHTDALQRRLTLARSELAYARAHARDVDPEDLAAAAMAVGERSMAFALLRRIRGHLDWIAIENDPRFDAMRDDASFRQLAQSQA
jgi:DNA-binding winged helix-turn-helix (wHTH) protein/Tfp pilus assembly protein PilF